MPKSRRHLKMRRRLTKKMRKRGGQVETPLSDISTNSSMHDLDDITGTTTEESTLLDESVASQGSAPVATNLLGQFNAEAPTEELTNNTTAETSDNSFSDVASSFGDLAQGGKRKTRRNKKTRGKCIRKSRVSRKNRRVRRR